MRRIVVRPAAVRDLEEQAEYLARQGSTEAAVRFYRAAERTFTLIASQPEMGRVRPFRRAALAGVRVFPLQGFQRHLIFYRPLTDGIEVLRVLHGARDIERLFE